jgi:hypothetical protein
MAGDSRHRAFDRNADARLIEETDRAGQGEDEHDAEHDAPVADAVGDESLLRRVARLLTVDVVADEQVGTQSHAFPADEHQQEIVGQHQRQHHEHEQVQIGEEAVEALIAVHVADGKTWMSNPTNVMKQA